MRFEQVISEGITHVEDLAVHDFIDALRNFDQYEISEKVDGSNIRFGIDNHGFYTTRETKGGERVHDVEEYAVQFSTTFQRSAHLALEAVLPIMEKYGLSTGDQVEAEVLFGKLPNAVPYSGETNQIIFLRVITGEVELDQLKESLDGETITINLEAPYTLDGKSVRIIPEEHIWTFAKTPTYDANDIIDGDILERVNDELDQLEKYLAEPSGVWKFSNAEALAIPLNRRPPELDVEDWKHIKQKVKAVRDEIKSHIYARGAESRPGFVSGIKETLLNHLVRQIQSAFGPEIEDGGWIEGVVFKHKDTGSMFKIIDKDMFTLAKDFMWQVRKDLSEKPTSVHKIESFIGKVLHGLASAIGHPELGTTQAKRYLKKHGDTPVDILAKLDHTSNFHEVKQYWMEYINSKEEQLMGELDKYNDEKGSKVLHVKLGNHTRTFKYDEEIDARTLQVFTMLFNQLENFKKGTNKAEDHDDLVKLLAGRQLSTL